MSMTKLYKVQQIRYYGKLVDNEDFRKLWDYSIDNQIINPSIPTDILDEPKNVTNQESADKHFGYSTSDGYYIQLQPIEKDLSHEAIFTDNEKDKTLSTLLETAYEKEDIKSGDLFLQVTGDGVDEFMKLKTIDESQDKYFTDIESDGNKYLDEVKNCPFFLQFDNLENLDIVSNPDLDYWSVRVTTEDQFYYIREETVMNMLEKYNDLSLNETKEASSTEELIQKVLDAIEDEKESTFINASEHTEAEVDNDNENEKDDDLEL